MRTSALLSCLALAVAACVAPSPGTDTTAVTPPAPPVVPADTVATTDSVGPYVPDSLVPTTTDSTGAGTAAPLAVSAFAVPDPKLSPGDTVTSDTSRICRTGFSKTTRLPVTSAMSAKVYAEYHRTKGPNCCRIDHVIPAELGGKSDLANYWPEPTRESFAKDSTENYARRLVCARTLSIQRAQTLFRTDWRLVLAAKRRRAVP